MRGTQIYNLFLQILHINIPKISGMSRPSFFFSEKKICKNKKYLPTMSAKESALIPLVKNLNSVSDKKCTGIFGVSPQVLFNMPISKYVWPVFCLQISIDQAPIDYVYLRVFSSCLQCLYSKTWLVLFRHLSLYLFRCLIINFC
jgi:hypothetical protein